MRNNTNHDAYFWVFFLFGGMISESRHSKAICLPSVQSGDGKCHMCLPHWAMIVSMTSNFPRKILAGVQSRCSSRFFLATGSFSGTNEKTIRLFLFVCSVLC